MESHDYQQELSRIENEVDAGDADLAALGFWKVVARAKRDPRVSDAAVETIARIDRKAFEARVRPLFPVWLGNLVLLVGTAVMLIAIPIGFRVAEGTIGEEPRAWLGGLIVLAAGAGLSVTVHAPAHWFVGRWSGIRFTRYFLDGPFRIQPGVKTDYASYLRASPSARAGMHAAGALASKVAPFVVFAWAYVVHLRRDWDLLPAWSLWGLLGLGVLQILTDVVWSTKRSDWKKVRRELRIARELGNAGQRRRPSG